MIRIYGTTPLIKQLKLKPSIQLACLIWRVNYGGGPEILLVTSRDTGRWILPKGWPMKGKKPHEAAQIEAFEEAGALGDISKKPIGHYDYFKRLNSHFELTHVVVYPMRFKEQSVNWRERGQRQTRWIEPELAAELVDEPALKSLLADFHFPESKPVKAKPGKKKKKKAQVPAGAAG